MNSISTVVTALLAVQACDRFVKVQGNAVDRGYVGSQIENYQYGNGGGYGTDYQRIGTIGGGGNSCPSAGQGAASASISSAATLTVPQHRPSSAGYVSITSPGLSSPHHGHDYLASGNAGNCGCGLCGGWSVGGGSASIRATKRNQLLDRLYQRKALQKLNGLQHFQPVHQHQVQFVRPTCHNSGIYY
ncbi:Hypothetical protein CINCED_3A004011 [Cinara cedri]|nr:Hypothetical protein CINCED_3A004011 [Cinara cedri]